MGCHTSRPAKKIALDKGILERERELEKYAEKDPSVDGYVQSRQNKSEMVLEPVKLSGEQHKKPKSKAEDQTRSPLHAQSKPQEIIKDKKLNNVGLAQNGAQDEEQAKANESVATSPGALATSPVSSDCLSITVEDPGSNILFDSRWEDLGKRTQSSPHIVASISPIISPHRATSLTIPGNTEIITPVEEELKLAHIKLTESETIISERDKRIQELLDENRKLKNRKSHDRQLPSGPVFVNKTSTRFKDKIRDIKKAANFDRSASYTGIPQSYEREQFFTGTRASTSWENKRSQTPEVEVASPEIKSYSSLHSSFKDSTFLSASGESGQLPYVPLKFGLTVEESKKRRQSRDEAGNKSNSEGGSGQWEYSEMLMI